jgi:hypothetical protein
VKRSAEISLEVAIGLAVVLAAYLWATLAPNREVPVRWFGLVISTLILFGYPIYWARKKVKLQTFWLYWLGFLIIHLAVFVLILHEIHQWPLVLFIWTTLAELAVINPILNKTLQAA